MIARAIHFSGDRATKPFIGVSCAALAETLLESELFGHEKGSFTGATSQKKGKFEMAAGDNFPGRDRRHLCEIADGFIRVLQERSFYRVGGSEEIQVDVRVIAATNTSLLEAVAAGKFRDDLFYRLNVIYIHIPPLRERREDIPLLAHNFIERLSHELGKEVGDLSEGALKVLLDHNWPGNVRELENAVERAIVTCRTRMLTEDDFGFLNHGNGEKKKWAVPDNVSLEEMEKQLLTATLLRTKGNIKEAADILEIDRSTLYEKIKKYNIPR